MFLAETAANAADEAFKLFGMSNKFWVVIIVFVLFVGAILTAAYNDDKTSGL